MKRNTEFTIETTVRNWRKINRIVNKITDEFRLRMGKNGARISVVDPAHVWLADVFITDEFFSRYDLNKQQTIALSTDWIEHVTKKVKGNYKMELTYYSNKMCTYTIHYPWGNLVSKRFQLDTEGIAQPRVPSLIMDEDINLDDEIFWEAIKKLDEGHYVRVQTNEDILSISYSWENDEHEEDEEESDVFTISLKNTKHKTNNSNAMFGTDYLQDMMKAMPKSVKLQKIRFSTDNPMELHFKQINKNKKAELAVMYMLAPRIESSQDDH